MLRKDFHKYNFSNNMNEKQSMLTDEEMLRDSSQFYGIKHENICSLIGHIVDNGEPLAIFPWAESKFKNIISR